MQVEWVAAWATAVGAAATAISAGIIAAQTAATRRSVQVSQAVQLQSARARLDARAPRLSLTIGAVRWPPHHLASHDVTQARGAAVTVTEQFHLPGDGPRRLLLEAVGQLRNDGERTLSIEVAQPLMPWPAELELPDSSRTSITSQLGVREEARRSRLRAQLQLASASTVVLAPQAVEPVRLRLNVAIADLVDGLRGTAVSLVVDDGFDEGVTDTYTFAVVGRALVPVPSDHAGYTIAGFSPDGRAPLHASTVVITRRYFFSKTPRNEMTT